MKKTKKMLVALYVGAIVALPRIAQAIEIDWGFGVSVGSGGTGGIGGGSGRLNNSAYGLPGGSIFGIIQNILYWMLGILSAVSIIGFIIAGVLYLTAAGDETQAGKAKKAMLYSIIGVVVALSGFVVFQAAQSLLGARTF